MFGDHRICTSQTSLENAGFLKVESNYEAKWQEYRHLRRVNVIVFGGFLILALIVAAVSRLLFPNVHARSGTVQFSGRHDRGKSPLGLVLNEIGLYVLA